MAESREKKKEGESERKKCKQRKRYGCQGEGSNIIIYKLQRQNEVNIISILN